MGKTDLFATVKELACERKSLYRGSVKERRKLLDFLEMNGWFGQDVGALPNDTVSAGKKLYVTEEKAAALCSSLHLWLDGFRKGNSEKLEILMRHARKTLPQTAALYQEYIEGENLEDDISAWRLFDFLLFYLPGEITELNPTEMEKLVDTLDIEATRAVSELFAGLNAWMQKKLGISGWLCRFAGLFRFHGLSASWLLGFRFCICWLSALFGFSNCGTRRNLFTFSRRGLFSGSCFLDFFAHISVTNRLKMCTKHILIRLFRSTCRLL